MTTKINRDIFYRLASDVSDERMKAAMMLVQELSAIDPLSDSTEWKYVIDRLTKGLSSNRNSARVGFSLCISEVISLALERRYMNSIHEYLELLDHTFILEKGKNGKEERCMLFGKLFGLQALLNEPLFSKVFLSKEKLDISFFNEFSNHIIELSLLKTWLKEPSLFALYQLIEKISVLLNEQSIILILKLLDKYNLTLTNEGLAIYLFIIHKSPKTKIIIQKSNLLSDISFDAHWKHNNPLMKGNLLLLSSVLQEIAYTQDSSLKQKGFWSHRLHFVWDIILEVLINNNFLVDKSNVCNHKKRKRDGDSSDFIQFSDFWNVVLNESFFNEKSSSERKYLGFLILEKALLYPAHYISIIFSKNIVRTLINHAADSKRLLHKVSRNILTNLIEISKKDPSKITPIIGSLCFTPQGSVHFDQLTKTKTIHTLISVRALDSSQILNLVNLFDNNLLLHINEPSYFKTICDLILHVIRVHKDNYDLVWVNPLLSLLIRNSFFEVGSTTCHSGTPEYSDVLNTFAQERLYSVLTELLSVNYQKAKQNWLNITLQLINSEEKSHKLSYTLDPELIHIRSDAINSLKRIEVVLKTDSENKQLRALELLFTASIMQLYSGDTESLSILDQLFSFYKSLDTINDQKGDLSSITEIILSLITQKKAFSKKIALLAWELFVPQISENELNVLLEVLSARENKEGFSALFERMTEDLDSTVECSHSDNEEDDDDDFDNEDSNSYNAQVEKIDQEASKQLSKVLNLDQSTHGNSESDDNVILDQDVDDESNSDSMDDEAMLALDDQLSQIFKTRKEALGNLPTGNQRKLEAKAARETVVGFKYRVVDMLKIYINFVEKSYNDKNLLIINQITCVLKIMISLIECIRKTVDKVLAEKIQKLIKTNICKLKPSLFNEYSIPQNIVLSHLEEIHKAIAIDKPGHFQHLYFSTCSTSSIFLSKIFTEIKSDNSVFDELIEIYSKSMKDWLIKGHFGTTFFIDFINWLSAKKTNFEYS